MIARDCVNSAKDFAQGALLVIAGARIPSDLLADAGRPLKQFLTQ